MCGLGRRDVGKCVWGEGGGVHVGPAHAEIHGCSRRGSTAPVFREQVLPMTKKGNFGGSRLLPPREQPFFRGSTGTLFTRAEPDLFTGPITPMRTAGWCFRDVVLCHP